MTTDEPVTYRARLLSFLPIPFTYPVYSMISHPLSSFSYCPRCGQQGLEHVHGRAIHCPSCDLTYFHNVASAVACFVLDEAGQLLTVRRAREPEKGTLDLPGGFVDPEETVEEAVRRELREETGLEATEVRLLFSIPNVYPYSGIDVYTADLFYLTRVKSFEGAKAMDDAGELVLVEPKELRHEAFGLRSIRAAVERVVADPALIL